MRLSRSLTLSRSTAAHKNSPSFYGVTAGVKVHGLYEAYQWLARGLRYAYLFVSYFTRQAADKFEI